MTLLFIDSAGHIPTNVNNPTYGKWDGKTGTGAYRAYLTGSRRGQGHYQGFGASSYSCYIHKAFPSQDTWIWGFGSRPRKEAVLAELVDASTVQLRLSVNADGALCVYRGTSTALGQSADGVVTFPNTWNYIEWKAIIHNESGYVEVRVGGTPVLTLSDVNTCASGNNQATLIRQYFQNGTTTDSNLSACDIYVLDGSGDAPYNDFLGDMYVDALLPDGAGNYTQWTPSAGSNYENVDDTVLTDADYNRAASMGLRDSFTFGSLAGTPGQILGVQLVVCARRTDEETAEIAPFVRIGGTDYDLDAASLTSFYAFHNRVVLTTNPATGLAWTTSDIAALEAGYRSVTLTDRLRVTQMAAEVVYRAAPVYDLGNAVANGSATVSGDMQSYTVPTAEEPEPSYPAIVEYMLKIRQADGTLVALLTGDARGGSPDKAGFLSCTYRKAVNAAGLLAFVLDGESDAAALVEDNGIVEVWRRDNGNDLPWTRDFTGIVRRRIWRTKDRQTLTVYCPGLLYLLSQRHVLWYAGTADRSVFTSEAAETIAKTLVTYNATATASTANGRLVDGVITGLSVEADAAGGETLDWYCAWDNLLATLQDLCQVGGGDMDLVQTDDAAWEFRWYDGQLGTDRSASVVFALEYGNMAQPVYEDDRLDERNVVVALGQGEGSARATAIRTTGDADAEGTIDARHTTTAAGLQATADAKLVQWQQRQEFSFEALQTKGCLYGKHYVLGDLVTARYGGVYSGTRKVVGVTVAIDEDGAQTITPEFGAP